MTSEYSELIPSSSREDNAWCWEFWKKKIDNWPGTNESLAKLIASDLSFTYNLGLWDEARGLGRPKDTTIN